MIIITTARYCKVNRDSNTQRSTAGKHGWEDINNSGENSKFFAIDDLKLTNRVLKDYKLSGCGHHSTERHTTYWIIINDQSH